MAEETGHTYPGLALRDQRQNAFLIFHRIASASLEEGTDLGFFIYRDDDWFHAWWLKAGRFVICRRRLCVVWLAVIMVVMVVITRYLPLRHTRTWMQTLGWETLSCGTIASTDIPKWLEQGGG